MFINRRNAALALSTFAFTSASDPPCSLMLHSSIMTLSLHCSVVIEELASDKCTVKRRTALRESQISAVRDDLQQILIRITPMNNSGCKKMVKKSMGYPVIELDLYKNFLSQGKATICLPVHSVRIMISNCPPDKLRFFLGTLRTKLKTQKTHILKRPVPPDAPSTSISLLEEISPLSLPKKINSHPKVIEPFSCDMSVINFQDEVSNTCSQRCGSLRSTPLVSTPVRKVAAKSRGDTNRSFGHIFDSQESGISSQTGQDEQMTVINFVKQGCNVFCTGGAGTGKSHLIRRVVGLLPPEYTAVTASTGSAANIIGGLTVHAFSGLGGLLESDLKMDKDNILVWMEILRTRLKFRPDIVTRWQKLQYLVIDEISMLSSRLFTRLELIATECRRSMNKISEQKAFGGIQLVIFGDFFQLPPVVHPSEIIKTLTSQGNHGIQWTGWMQLDDLDFADDLALQSHTHQQKHVEKASVVATYYNHHKKVQVFITIVYTRYPISVGLIPSATSYYERKQTSFQVEVVRKRRWRWIGHTLRKSQNCITSYLITLASHLDSQSKFVLCNPFRLFFLYLLLCSASMWIHSL
ncbi:unnamed protein product [Schistosoma margrebowiei]|uniref:ATP-dependent DNA helicase n=1 Tax=Schistosoma margrebowiei TaxID=48269 RepID=A0A183N3A7_9TREM|nr:unnamed protein product [Schistosoma margrebowiei]